jgi:hypothetical protein
MAENRIEGEGSYTAGKKYQQEQHKFAKEGPVEQKAREAEEALDGPEAEALERARREAADKRPG